MLIAHAGHTVLFLVELLPAAGFIAWLVAVTVRPGLCSEAGRRTVRPLLREGVRARGRR